MKPSYPIQEEMSQVVALVHQYLDGRLRKESISFLNQIIHDLRVLLKEVVTNYFLHLSLPEAKEFKSALADQLTSVCSDLSSRCSKEDEEHHRYCVREVMVCFEWAQQIKEEIPDDPLTQKILAIDIPILRPFDYGLRKAKIVRHPVKNR